MVLGREREGKSVDYFVRFSYSVSLIVMLTIRLIFTVLFI